MCYLFVLIVSLTLSDGKPQLSNQEAIIGKVITIWYINNILYYLFYEIHGVFENFVIEKIFWSFMNRQENIYLCIFCIKQSSINQDVDLIVMIQHANLHLNSITH